MKKVFSIIVFLFLFLNVYSIGQNTANTSFSVSPLTFLTLISSGSDDEYGNQAFPYISFSLNIPKKNVEKDIFISLPLLVLNTNSNSNIKKAFVSC